MGDPKFSRRSYDTPSHPWQGERIKAEVVLVKSYGLKNKTAVWKAQSVLRKTLSPCLYCLGGMAVKENGMDFTENH